MQRTCNIATLHSSPFQDSSGLHYPLKPVGPRPVSISVLSAAISELEAVGAHNPAAAIDLLIAHHGAVAAYGCPNNTPRHVITCAGAEGDGPTPSDALHAWTIRARYLLAGAVQ